MAALTPLRYPGGKGKLGAWVAWTMRCNGISGGIYSEAYAGGAGAGIYLLMNEYVRSIRLNDIDPVIYSFWWAILNETDEFLQTLRDTPVTLETRSHCVDIVKNPEDHSTLELGFAGFFLNRVNRSGIVKGGVIGGNDQTGPYKIDARFNKANLEQRIKRIAERRSRITISCLDALDFIRQHAESAPTQSLLYLDPPYFEKAEKLYRNFYTPEDHAAIAEEVAGLNTPWLVTYDNHEYIRNLYDAHASSEFSLIYSTALSRPRAKEVMFFGNMDIPDNPRLTKTAFPYPQKWDKNDSESVL